MIMPTLVLAMLTGWPHLRWCSLCPRSSPRALRPVALVLVPSSGGSGG